MYVPTNIKKKLQYKSISYLFIIHWYKYEIVYNFGWQLVLLLYLGRYVTYDIHIGTYTYAYSLYIIGINTCKHIYLFDTWIIKFK